MSINYNELDPGIRKVVRLLNDNGYTTTDSGDGYSKKGTDQEECMLEIPNVVILTDRENLLNEADRLLALLTEQGVQGGPDQTTVEELAGPQPEGTEFGDGVMIEASYDPEGQSSVILLTGLDDDLLARCQTRVR
jgi:hypothetical protein